MLYTGFTVNSLSLIIENKLPHIAENLLKNKFLGWEMILAFRNEDWRSSAEKEGEKCTDCFIICAIYEDPVSCYIAHPHNLERLTSTEKYI